MRMCIAEMTAESKDSRRLIVTLRASHRGRHIA